MAKRKLDQIGPSPKPLPEPATPHQVAPFVPTDGLSKPRRRRKANPAMLAVVATTPLELRSEPVPQEQYIAQPQAGQIDPTPDDESEYYEENAWQRTPLWLRLSGSLLVLSLLLVGSFELVYADKIYPGVSADGVYVGGQSRTEAGKRVAQKTTQFAGQVITISNGDTNLRIPVASLAVKYDAAHSTDLAYNYGRQGTFWNKVQEQARALIGRATNFSTYTYDDARLVPYLVELDNDLTTPVKNASLSFNNSQAQVTPAQAGTRLSLGRLTQLVKDRLSQTSTDSIEAPVYQLAPDLGTNVLQDATKQLDTYLSAPVMLSYVGTDHPVDQSVIISWIQVGNKPTKPFLATLKVDDLYPPPAAVSLSLNRKAIETYVVGLAGGLDQTAQNARLVMQDGQLIIAEPSRTGIKVDQAGAVKGIEKALELAGDQRKVAVALQTTQADVNESNLVSLGIKELISEGQTFFPGSPNTRLTNVRAGAKKFNGVLLKPDEVFSFGALLGAVGPETGYVPELVILADHEEKQYGGGLCQVSSTAFRAALAAGLPILERHNHSFAISYYTAPYNAPGVDATIYYPQVDFKFKNDTGSYILMQTTMQGTTLKFDFYGTKTKSGTIRGPEFISGTNDATKSSHTVFYRDVLDLAGKVTKTDTFHTYYKPSTDFPITQQFN